MDSAGLAQCDMEMYTPITDRWQSMKSIQSEPDGTLILVREEFCEVTSEIIHIHDPGKNLLRLWHRLSLEGVSPGALQLFKTMVVIEVADDELIAVVHWMNGDGSPGESLLKTVGLGGQRVAIEWQRTPGFTSSANWDGNDDLKYYICPMRL